MIEEREFQVIWENGVREALKRRINLVHFFSDIASILACQMSSDFELVCIACQRQTFLLAHRRWGTFRESLSGDEWAETSAVRRLWCARRMLIFMSELLTRFYFRVNCFLLKHFFKWVTVTEIPKPYSLHDNKKKSWISNNETKTERRVDPELQTLTRECALQDLYRIWLLTMSFKCYLYYDTETSVRPGLIEIIREIFRASKTS